MKRFFYPLVVLLYTLSGLSLYSVFTESDDTLVSNLILIISLVIILYCCFIIVHALLSKKLDEQTVVKTTLIVKSLLIPFYVIAFIFGILIAFGSLVFVLVLPLLIFIVFLIALFVLLVVVTTSMYNVKILFINRDKINKIYFIHIILHFIYVTDLISSILVYNDYKNKLIKERLVISNEP